jgi:hypothetical protein
MGSYVALKILAEQLDPFSSRQHQQMYAITNASNKAMSAPYSAAPSRPGRPPPLPWFGLSRAWSCELPGGMFYFNCRLPVVPPEAISYITNCQNPNDSNPQYASAPNRNCVLKVLFTAVLVFIQYIQLRALPSSHLL